MEEENTEEFVELEDIGEKQKEDELDAQNKKVTDAAKKVGGYVADKAKSLGSKIGEKWNEYQTERKENKSKENEIKKEAKEVRQQEYFAEKKKVAVNRAKEIGKRKANRSFYGDIVKPVSGAIKKGAVAVGTSKTLAHGLGITQSQPTQRKKVVTYVKKGKHYVKKVSYVNSAKPVAKVRSNPMDMFKMDFGTNIKAPNANKNSSQSSLSSMPSMNSMFKMNVTGNGNTKKQSHNSPMPTMGNMFGSSNGNTKKQGKKNSPYKPMKFF